MCALQIRRLFRRWIVIKLVYQKQQRQNYIKYFNQSVRFRYTCPNGRLTENVFKRVSSNPNLNPNSNPKAQNPFRKKRNDIIFRANVQITLGLYRT